MPHFEKEQAQSENLRIGYYTVFVEINEFELERWESR